MHVHSPLQSACEVRIYMVLFFLPLNELYSAQVSTYVGFSILHNMISPCYCKTQMRVLAQSEVLLWIIWSFTSEHRILALIHVRVLCTGWLSSWVLIN